MGAALVAVVGGAINSIAGGGTLVTFPMIVALGISPLVANATNTMALWPGAFGSVWGYRAQFAPIKRLMPRFSLASLLGGVTGGLLLLKTGNDRFQQIVPFLILGATILFMLQAPLTQALRSRIDPTPLPELAQAPWGFVAGQFLVGVYGGFFGAGIGILMLAVLGLMGFTDIHQANALKVWGAWLANMVAGLVFAVSGVVNWPLALVMAAGGTGISALLAARIATIAMTLTDRSPSTGEGA